MLLLVDVGNTNVTLALASGTELRAVRRAATPTRATSDELEVLIEGLLALDGAALADVASIACCSRRAPSFRRARCCS